MTDFVNGIGNAIGGAVQGVANAATGAFFALVHTIDGIVPGGFPVFVVLGVIGILVGWASLKR
jgi:membrane protease YdiL (CAAX protease family)